MMNDLSRGLKNTRVYLDEKIIFTKNLGQHIEERNKLMDIMEVNDLRINSWRSTFITKEENYFGYRICACIVRLFSGKIPHFRGI